MNKDRYNNMDMELVNLTLKPTLTNEELEFKNDCDVIAAFRSGLLSNAITYATIQLPITIPK